MIDYFRNLLGKKLSGRSLKIIKKNIVKFKSNYPGLLTLIHGKFTSKDLIDKIEERVDNGTEIIMLHTSLNNLNPMYQGNVNELLDHLMNFAEKRNITLVMPGFVLGKGNSGIENFYLKRKKFDPLRTATTVGLINECFRRRAGVKRSLHPSHSLLAWGPKAEELTVNHHLCETTFGENTPFHKLEKYNTIIIGLGTYYYRNLTHVHVVEDLMRNKFPFPAKEVYNIVPVSLLIESGNISYNLKVFRKEISARRDLSILKKMDSANLIQFNFHGVPMFFANPSKVTETLFHLAKEGKTIYN